MLNRILSGVVTLVLLSTAHSSLATELINGTDPYTLIEKVAQQTFARFKADKTKIDQDKNYLKVIVDEELMPYVDHRYAGLKAMGRHARGATKTQRQQFVDAFRAYLIRTYADALGSYTNQTLEFGPVRPWANEKDVRVYVKVLDQSRPDIDVEFRLRKQKDNSWKAYDLKAEGISILRSKTKEFDGLIRQHGVDKFIEMLNQKAAEAIQNNQENAAA